MTRHRPAPPANADRGRPSTPVCRLTRRRDGVDAILTHRGRVIGRTHLGDAPEHRLSEMIDGHRASFDDPWELDPYDVWTTATGRYLADVHDLLVSPLRPLLGGEARVELLIEDPLLQQLPWETAHRPDRAGLFERCQLTRGHVCVETTCRRDRRFRLEYAAVDTDDLPGTDVEGIAVVAAHAGRSGAEPTERLVHIAGHRPVVPPDLARAGERAHIVLSGCDSLPRRLPEGVASATASLWPIDDQASPITMTLFHARVATGVGPLEALRQAQVMQRAQAPTVWAAYVHLGCPS